MRSDERATAVSFEAKSYHISAFMVLEGSDSDSDGAPAALPQPDDERRFGWLARFPGHQGVDEMHPELVWAHPPELPEPRPVARPLSTIYDYFVGDVVIFFDEVQALLAEMWQTVLGVIRGEPGAADRMPEATAAELEACRVAATQAEDYQYGLATSFIVLMMAYEIARGADLRSTDRACRLAHLASGEKMLAEIGADLGEPAINLLDAAGLMPADDQRYDALMAEVGHRMLAYDESDPVWDRFMAQCAIVRVCRAVAKVALDARHESPMDALKAVIWRIREWFNPEDIVNPIELVD